MRLKGYKCFNHLYKEGHRYYGSCLVLRVAKAKPILLKVPNQKSNLNSLKCAVSISHKVSKKAVERNKLRRLFHNYFTQIFEKVNTNNSNWFLLSLKPICSEKDSENLLKECEHLLLKSGLLK
tara:strand:- start:755 stop:1123 length:369 start_codon:yes stop_codon:yes gene_type:complete